MSPNLSNKIILVTGASEGIGRAIAEELGRHHATVILTARRQNLLEEVARAVVGSGGQAMVITTDLRKSAQISNLVHTVHQQYGRIDVLINAAAMGYYDWLEEQTFAELEEQLQTNILGLVEITRQIVPIMKKQHSGHIVNFASYASQISTPPLTIYSTTKYAVEGFTDGIRRELLPWNIHVTRVHPSAVNTNFNQKAKRHDGIDYPYDKITGVTKEIVAKKVVGVIYRPRHAVFAAKLRLLVDLTVFLNRYLPGVIDVVFRFRTPQLWRSDKHDPQADAVGIKAEEYQI